MQTMHASHSFTVAHAQTVQNAMARKRVAESGGFSATGGILPDEHAFLKSVRSLREMRSVMLFMAAHGKLNKQFAHACGITPTTTKLHVSQILKRLKVRSRTEAAVKLAVLLERCSGRIDPATEC